MVSTNRCSGILFRHLTANSYVGEEPMRALGRVGRIACYRRLCDGTQPTKLLHN